MHYRLLHSRESPELGEQLQNALSYENIALEGGWNLVTVFSNGSHNPAYSNYFSPTEGTIYCLANDKMKDVNESEHRLELSEVIFQFHQMEVARTLQLTRNLETIWRLYIVDQDDGLPYTEYRQGDGGSFALLGCPNGSGVIRILIDHCNALGHKTIASVRVVNDSPPVMYFVLADSEISAPASKSKRSQVGQERAAKRHKKSPLGEGQGPRLSGNA